MIQKAAADRLATTLAKLHERGRTVILVSHDLARAAALAQAALVLRDGRISLSASRPGLTTLALERAMAEASA